MPTHPARPVLQALLAVSVRKLPVLQALQALLAAWGPRFQVRPVPREASAHRRWVPREASGQQAIAALLAVSVPQAVSMPPQLVGLGQQRRARMKQLAA